MNFHLNKNLKIIGVQNQCAIRFDTYKDIKPINPNP